MRIRSAKEQERRYKTREERLRRLKLSPARQVRFEQQRIVDEIKGQGNLRSLDDEALLVMMRMAVRDSSPCDDKIKFVFQDEADETSCIASKDESVEKTNKGRFEHGAASTDVQRG